MKAILSDQKRADTVLSNLDNKQEALYNLGARVGKNLLDNPQFSGASLYVTSGISYYSDSALTELLGTTSKEYPVISVTSSYAIFQGDTGQYYIDPFQVMQYAGTFPVNYQNRVRYTNNDIFNRWKSINSCTVEIQSDYVELTSTSATSMIRQYINQSYREGLLNQVCTFSAFIKGTAGNTVKLQIGTSGSATPTLSGDWEILSGTFPMDESMWASLWVISGSVQVKAMKLELGEVQTLGRQLDDGSWIQTDFPNFADEYWACAHATTAGDARATLLGEPLTIYKYTTIDQNRYSGINFTTVQKDNSVATSNAYIRVFDDHDANNYGTNMVIQSAGSMTIGSGESPNAVYTNELMDYTGEGLFLTADTDIHFYSNANTYANKLEMTYAKSGNLTVPGIVTAASFSGDLTGNASTATKWATARNINGLSIDGSANRVNYGTCSTAAATAAKTVACTGFALVTGAEITVKFTVTNTASSPTLNVNSTGAKAIYYRGSAITAGYLAAKRTYTFRYNGTQYDLVGDINTDTNTTYTLSSITGTLAVSKGGTGRTTLTSGYFLRGNGTGAITMTSPADVLTALGISGSGGMQYQELTYVGTGVYGDSNKNSLTFDFAPVLILLSYQNPHSGNWYFQNWWFSNNYLWCIITSNNEYTSLSGNTFTWYSYQSADYQYNNNGYTYKALAIG